VINKPWVRKNIKRYIKESKYLKYIRLIWPDYRVWLRKSGTLPSFLVIGAQRAGSTFLHDCLVSTTSAECSPLQKEVHYFDNKYYKSLKWYGKYFGRRDRNNKNKNFEASPYYIYHPAVPGRVAKSLPNVKILVILRNPVDRAVSHYKWMRQTGLEKRTPKTAFREDAQRLSLETNRDYLTKFENPLYFDFDHIYKSYLRRSIYDIQLKRWLKYFPESQIRVINFRSLINNTEFVINKVSEFAMLRRVSSYEEKEINQNSSKTDVRITDEAREIARRHLAEVPRRLQSVISQNMIIGEELRMCE
jgi:LPS sulfotransferase NodH